MKKVILSMIGKRTLKIIELDTLKKTRKDFLFDADMIDYRSLIPTENKELEHLFKRKE